jgi:hypothetical protein
MQHNNVSRADDALNSQLRAVQILKSTGSHVNGTATVLTLMAAQRVKGVSTDKSVRDLAHGTAPLLVAMSEDGFLT